jgi:lysophospholipase L1-like esterase
LAEVLTVALLLGASMAAVGERRVSLVGDSLLACARDAVVTAVEAGGDRRVHAEYLQGGCTAYTNTINGEIARRGAAAAFAEPDAVVFSFGGNEIGRVARGAITFEYATEHFHRLLDAAREAGASCVVMLESSHRFRGEPDIGEEFTEGMDRWFAYWSGQGKQLASDDPPFRLLIADISEAVHADIDRYIGDYIHFNEAGARLAADAIVEQLDACPP